MSKYLNFVQGIGSESGKTEIWYVESVRHGDVLGLIRWYGPWRQYTFHPRDETIYNPDCLDDIAAFIRGLMEARKR